MRRTDFPFWRLWSANVLNLFSAGAWIVAFPIVAMTGSYPPSLVGAVTTAYLVGTISALVAGGLLIDVYSKSKIMAISSSISAGCYLVAATSLDFLLGNMAAFLGLAIALGISDALYGPASEAIVPEVVKDNSLIRANSWISMAESLAAKLVGPALAGVAVVVVGERQLFIVLALCSLVAAFLSFSLRVPAVVKTSGLEGDLWLGGTLAGVRVIFTSSWLRMGLTWSAIALLLQYGSRVVLMPYWFQQLGEPADYALSISSLGVGALFSGWAMMKVGKRCENFGALMAFWVLGSLCWLPIVFIPNGRVAVLIMLIMGFFNSAGNIVWSSLLQSDVPERFRGRVASADWLVSISLMPVSAVVSGLIATDFMTEWIAVSALLPTLLGIIIIVRERQSRAKIDMVV